ncbi:MAG: TfuA-like protein [Chloroflexota bacterium]
MKYNPQTPFAVFLGPSFDSTHASQLLAANYYPPARMGDIYRLLGSGVRIIVLIDGVFHGEASVWQREIVEALTNNIQVIGASSMGALRAAELHTFGMIGHGTIFEWYREGVIDGDDEVALMHGDSSVGYQAFSEPLVNIRYTLHQATKQRVISLDQARNLISLAKNAYYADRSYDFLLESLLVKKWPHEHKNRLRRFVNQQSINLKRQDAINALRFCARIAKEEYGPTSFPVVSIDPNPYYQSARYGKRVFLDSRNNLITADKLFTKVSQDACLVGTLKPILIKNHYLICWVKQNSIRCPEDYRKNFSAKWQEDYIEGTPAQWLRFNGLAEREFQTELDKRALVQWILDQNPSHFGIDFQRYAKFVDALSSLNPPDNETVISDIGKKDSQDEQLALVNQISTACYLTAWAKQNGIDCPTSHVVHFIQTWEKSQDIRNRKTWLNIVGLDEDSYLPVLAELALCEWLIEKGPIYFGYISWSFEVVLLKELQITGRAARIVEAMVELVVS